MLYRCLLWVLHYTDIFDRYYLLVLYFVWLDHRVLQNSPVENQNDLELDFKVFFFADSCCSDIVLDESN